MARPFKSKDVAAIKAWHTERLGKLEVLSSVDVAGVEAVKSFAQSMYQDEIDARLRQIPVERIGAQRKGLRISALRLRGYETVADVLMAPADRVFGRGIPKSHRVVCPLSVLERKGGRAGGTRHLSDENVRIRAVSIRL